jgi:hypothetical protein
LFPKFVVRPGKWFRQTVFPALLQLSRAPPSPSRNADHTLANPREKRPKGRDGPNPAFPPGGFGKCGLNAIPANAAWRLADRWSPPGKMGQPTVASFDMTTLLCAIGAIIILVYSAFVAAYVRRVAKREQF